MLDTKGVGTIRPHPVAWKMRTLPPRLSHRFPLKKTKMACFPGTPSSFVVVGSSFLAPPRGPTRKAPCSIVPASADCWVVLMLHLRSCLMLRLRPCLMLQLAWASMTWTKAPTALSLLLEKTLQTPNRAFLSHRLPFLRKQALNCLHSSHIIFLIPYPVRNHLSFTSLQQPPLLHQFGTTFTSLVLNHLSFP